MHAASISSQNSQHCKFEFNQPPPKKQPLSGGALSRSTTPLAHAPTHVPTGACPECLPSRLRDAGGWQLRALLDGVVSSRARPGRAEAFPGRFAFRRPGEGRPTRARAI